MKHDWKFVCLCQALTLWVNCYVAVSLSPLRLPNSDEDIIVRACRDCEMTVTGVLFNVKHCSGDMLTISFSKVLFPLDVGPTILLAYVWNNTARSCE